jgi:hypothetical protein
MSFDVHTKAQTYTEAVSARKYKSDGLILIAEPGHPEEECAIS